VKIQILAFLLIGIMYVGPASAELRIDSAALSAMELPPPKTAEAAKYLGISQSGPFKISEISAEVVVIEIFSMYCPYCQTDAPNVNELYKLIQGDPSLKKKIRMIGIGTGNTPFEIEVFRKKYDVKFPLFPDEEFKVQKIASEPIRTPSFVTLKRNANKTWGLHKIHVGESKESGAFLKEILQGTNSK
jgi:thiol-disulfide isomerase/thioredoxin